MEYLNISKVQAANSEGVSSAVDRTVARYQKQLGLYERAIEKLLCGSQDQLAQAQSAIFSNPRTNPEKPVSRLSAPYFVNEDLVGGVLVKDAVARVNQEYASLGLPTTDGKVKLGPGIGYITAPSFYSELLKAGMDSPDLSVNYNAPNGEKLTRTGLSLLVNAKTEKAPAYGEFDVFLTSGATEAIDATIAAFQRLKPGKSVTLLGPSYYAAPYSSQYRGIKVDQLVETGEGAPLFPSPEKIRGESAKDTGLFVIASPANPTGEMYSEQNMREILKFAKEKDILVLFDDIFGRLSFSPRKNPVQIAQETDTLANLVVVDSLSKSLNLPGARAGVIATTNPALGEELGNYLIAEKCNPPLTYGPLLAFEGLARETEKRMKGMAKADPGRIFDELTSGLKMPFSREWFRRAYREWNEWNLQSMEYYRQNLDLTRGFLDRTGTAFDGSADQGAFNTLIRLTPPGLQANSLDFLFKLMTGTATYTQTGPCFGMDQSKWDDFLGVWSRITYASDRDSLAEGLIRLSALARMYEERDLANPDKYPALQISYSNK